MNRRATIKSLGLISTHALFPGILAGFVAGCQSDRNDYVPVFFTEHEFATLAEMVDVILPKTKTRSASEVGTHHFLDEIFAKCMTPEQQKLIRDGLTTLMPSFSKATDKHALLTDIDKKAYENAEDAAWFRTVKQYTLVGFFTSEEGMTKASNYVLFPGDYKGEIGADEHTLNYGKTDMRYYL